MSAVKALLRFIVLASLAATPLQVLVAQVYVPTIIPFTPPPVYPDGVPGTDQSNSSDPNTPNVDVDLTFESSSLRTKQNLSHFLDQARQQNVEAANELDQLFSQVDVIGEVGKKMRSVGLNPFDSADAYAVYWIVSWSAANGRESPDDESVFQAVSRQVRAEFAKAQKFASLSSADKQQFAEALMVQALLLDSANDQSRGNPQLQKQLADAALAGARGMDLDLDKFTLTRDGFKMRQGAALDPAAAGEADPQLAAAAAQEAGAGEENTLATYAAIAAAAGAGLAGAYWLGRSGRG